MRATCSRASALAAFAAAILLTGGSPHAHHLVGNPRVSPLLALAVPISLASGQSGTVAWKLAICNPSREAYRPSLTARWVEPAVKRAVRVKSGASGSLDRRACTEATIAFDAGPGPDWELIEILDTPGTAPPQVIGTVGVTRQPTATSLSLQVTSEARGATDILLRSAAANPATVVIKNTDAAAKATPVQWHVQAGPWFAVGSAVIGRGTHFLDIPFRTLDGDGSWWWQLWPASRHGRLTFTLARSVGDTAPLITHVEPVRVRLTRFSEPWQSAVTTAIVLMLLAAGGLTAHVTTSVLPGLSRRKHLRLAAEQLADELAADPDEPAFEDVRFRMLEEADRTNTAVRAVSPWDPEHSTGLDTLETKLQLLDKQVRLLTRLRALSAARVRPIGSVGLVAGELVAELMLQAVDRIRGASPDAAALQLSSADLELAESIGNVTGHEHPKVRSEVEARCLSLASVIAKLQGNAHWETLIATIPETRVALWSIQDRSSHAGEQHTRELGMWTIHLMVKAFQGSDSEHKQRFDQVRTAVAQRRWSALREVDEQLSGLVATAATVAEAVTAGRAGCVVFPSSRTVHAGRSASFTAWFTAEDFNLSGVRQTWSCVWRTGVDGSPSVERVTGWTLWQRFRTGRRATVSLIGFEMQGQRILLATEARAELTLVSPVTSVRRPRWVHAAATGLLLQFVALVALLTSNLIVIEARDPLFAVIVVVAAGFTTSMARTIVTAGASRLGAALANLAPSRPSIPGSAAASAVAGGVAAFSGAQTGNNVVNS